MGLMTENVEKVFVFQYFLNVPGPTAPSDPEAWGSF